MLGLRSGGCVSWVRRIGFTALALALLAGRAAADVVKLENGDVLHGEVLGGDDKAIKFKHAFGQELVIEYAKIASVETDKPVEVKATDGSRFKGKLAPGKEKGLVVQTEAGGPVALGYERVAAVNEPPESAVWTGKIAIGGTIVDGNTRSKTLFGSFDAERLSKQDRIEAHAYYAYGTSHDPVLGGDVLATKKGFARIQYSYYVWKPLYIYVGGAMEYDRFQRLDLRSRGGGGLGYAFAETKELLARLEAGVEYVNEDYHRIDDRDFTSIRGALQLEWQVTDWLRLGEVVEIFPNTERFADFFMRSTSSANIALWKGFGLAGIAMWEHDAVPATRDRNRNDTTYIVTFTYVF